MEYDLIQQCRDYKLASFVFQTTPATAKTMEDLFLHADSALEDFALDYTLAEDTNAKYQREKERLYHEETSADARMENITHG